MNYTHWHQLVMSSHPHATAVLTPRKDASSTRPHSTQETARRITDQGGKNRTSAAVRTWSWSSSSATQLWQITVSLVSRYVVNVSRSLRSVMQLDEQAAMGQSENTKRVTVSCTVLKKQLPLGSKKATRKYFSVQWVLISENDH